MKKATERPWHVLERTPGTRYMDGEVRHSAEDESAALRWAAGKYHLTANELALLAASRHVEVERLGLIVNIRRIPRSG